MPTVGVVSLGAMGSAVADALGRGGVRVVATLEGRSERTARLAGRTASVRLLPDLTSVVREADVILSIVPPERASAAADTILRAAGAHAARPLLVELNAIAPATAVRIASAASRQESRPWTARSRDRRRGNPARHVSTSRGRAPQRSPSSPFEGVERIVVGDVVGVGVGGEDEHRVRLQGHHRAPPPGATRGACERRPGARSGRFRQPRRRRSWWTWSAGSRARRRNRFASSARCTRSRRRSPRRVSRPRSSRPSPRSTRCFRSHHSGERTPRTLREI